MNLRLRLSELRAALAFLVGRVVFGAGAYLLLLGGLMAGGAILWLLGLVLVFVVPLIAVGFAVVFVIGLLLRPVSPAAREWMDGQPLRRVAGTATLGAIRVLARLSGWWLLRCRALARRERERVAAYRGTEIVTAYRPLPDGAVRTAGVLGTDPATWRDLLYLAVEPAYALAASALAAWALGGGITLIVVALAEIPQSSAWTENPEIWLALAAGATALLVAPFLTYALAGLGVRLGAAMLSVGESARMRAELDEQRLRRQLAVDAAEHERRRIERDLHDGAQQRLVALGMTLGLARQALRTDPEAAADLVEEAHAEAKLAHAELRDLARGIHPAILADRGLDAALSALLRRMPLPVSIIVTMPRRPPAAVESAAYFVVSEALTNVSRHAAATRATVSVVEADRMLTIEIVDDGVGGAAPTTGSGLQGLQERIGALNGRLTLESPEGGPTTIRAEIPCGS